MMENDFLKSLTVFIHLCILNQRHDLFNIIEDILREFLNSFDALIYLVNQTSTPNDLLKALYFAVRNIRIMYRMKSLLFLRIGNEIRWD